eukprot:IDg19300t1
MIAFNFRLLSYLLLVCLILRAAQAEGGSPVLQAVEKVLPAAPGDAISADDELQNMSSAQLQELEQDTLKKVKESDEQLKVLRSETLILKKEQKVITSEADKLQGAREWETNEKSKRDKELSEVKKDVEKRRQKVDELNAHVKTLKKQIEQRRVDLRNITAQKENAARRYNSPSFGDVIDIKAKHWSTTSQKVFHKTRDSISPALNSISSASALIRRRVQPWPILDLAASLLLYGFFIGGAYAARRAYLRVRGHLTVARLLFLGDTFCACFWALMLLCYCFLWTDPLITVQSRSPRVFFIFQLAALIAYTNFVFLRVLLLASKLSLSALGETLAVVVVGHHYYERVWKPAVLDEPIHGTLFYYFCYAWLFLAFAYNRIHEFAPLKQLRGPKLPPLMAIRVIFARFFSKGVPDGDLETRPFVDMEDAGDHES